MAARNKTKPRSSPVKGVVRPRQGRVQPLSGLFFVTLTLLTALSIWSYSPGQNGQLHSEVAAQNLVGEAGVWVASYSLSFLGVLAWLLPFAFLWFALMYFTRKGHKISFVRYLAWAVLVVCLAIGASIYETHSLRPSRVYPAIEGREAASPHLFSWQSSYFEGGGIGGWLGTTLYRGLTPGEKSSVRRAYSTDGLDGAQVAGIPFETKAPSLYRFLGKGGSTIIAAVLAALSAGVIFRDNVAIYGWRGLVSFWRWRRQRHEAWREQAKAQAEARKLEKTREKQEAAARAQAEAEAENVPDELFEDEDSGPLTINLGSAKARRQAALGPDADDDEQDPGEQKPREEIMVSTRAPRKRPGAPIEVAPPTELKIVESERPKKATSGEQPLEKRGDYVFPPMRLLADAPDLPPDQNMHAHQEVAVTLVRTLGEFGVKVTMGEVHTGPVITRYDVYPAAGVRVEKIQNLDKNLALALKAVSVRILAPVPGKGCVGVEVPNAKPQSVFLREILESEDWANKKAEIPIVLGKEVSGRPLITDLSKMPHLLIAGSTGSGKTVCINAVVCSLLYHASPEDLRFVMVDPKIVEMQGYNSLPHMLIPVVTEPKKVPAALKYLIAEMERRYQMFAAIGVRNIAGYNAKRAHDKAAERHARESESELSPEERAAMNAIEVPRDADIELPDKLPYIVCIVDELADLMMVAPADIETGIARLAQLARAAGIHLILATQRPSVNVITGVIKANLPSRIAFKVAAKVDSRTILDGMGADQLIGRGDMLFLPPGSADLTRAQGAWVADEEITRVVDFLKVNGEPEFDEQFVKQVETAITEDGDGSGEEEDEFAGNDEMIRSAIEVIRSSKRASTSMLQRRLKIGYNRAARIMEELEELGIVGPENGAQPREILRDLDSL